MTTLDSCLIVAANAINNPDIAANATISFTTITSTPTLVLDEQGNLIPAEGDTEIVTLQCWLKEQRQKRDTPEMRDGADLNASYFEGRLVDPKTYDFPLKANGPITVTINNRVGTMLIDTRVLESPSSVQFGIAERLGQRVAFFVQFAQGD